MKSEHTIQLLLSGMLTWIGSKFQTFVLTSQKINSRYV